MNKLYLENREIDIVVARKKIKHTYIRVSGINKLFVSTNVSTKTEAIEKLLRKNRAKIVRMLESIENRPVVTYENAYLFGSEYPIEYIDNKKHQAIFKNKKIWIYGNRLDLKLKALETMYVDQAISKASKLLEELKPLISNDIDVDNITIKSQRMKTMLGSCNKSKRIIKLNSVLARFDVKYLKAIFVHELVHLNISGHQANFYRLLLKYEPGYRQIRRELLEMLRNFQF
ncbi:MAG: DUF45 domain-containing protein [Bacilli bacterium]|nr:DUF45 domain-containing protein [Bacilli bacterium]